MTVLPVLWPGLSAWHECAVRDLSPGRLKVDGLQGRRKCLVWQTVYRFERVIGQLSDADLESVHRSGRKTSEALTIAGADIERIANGEPLIDPNRWRRILSCISSRVR